MIPTVLKQLLIEHSDAHIAAERALNFLKFSASQVRRKGTAPRRPSGMMRGEIEWDINPQAQQLLGTSMVLVTPESQPDEVHPVVDQSASHAQWSGETQSKQITPSHGNGSLERPNITLKASYSPDLFSDILNFPQTWVDVAGTVEQIADIDWMGEN